MKPLERLTYLPDWPARMTAPVAAAYMGIPQSTFEKRFRPMGVKEGAQLLWARMQLDRYVAQQFGMEEYFTLARAQPEPDPYEEWKASQNRRAPPVRGRGPR